MNCQCQCNLCVSDRDLCCCDDVFDQDWRPTTNPPEQVYARLYNLDAPSQLGGWRDPYEYSGSAQNMDAAVAAAVKHWGLGKGTYRFACLWRYELQFRNVTVVTEPTVKSTVVR